MEINRDLVEARLEEVGEAIRLLRELTSADFEDLTVHQRLSMRYLVIQLVEAAAAVCLHVLHSMSERASGYPDCFLKMGRLGLIPSDLAERLASAARMGNLLVHRCSAVDDERVYLSVREGLGDFEEFSAAVRRVAGE